MGKEGDEFELNLELSIGRGYGKTEEKIAEICQENGDCGISRFNFYSATENNACELQRRKEIKGMRRQEARRRREEKKIKRARVVERECCSNGVGDDLRLCLFTNQKVQQCSAPRNGNLFVDCDSEHSNGRRTGNGNRSSGHCSSAISDYQTKSYRGGSSSDTGSHSTRQPLHQPTTSTTALTHLESHGSSEATQVLKVPPSTSNPLPKPDLSRDQTNNASSTSENLSRETSGGLNQKPSNINAPRMPCVSATGNGPNGRTIRGFLYKYTKMEEVSIVCVCHRRSFSPAGFVEHAGGVDISHPLKHITIVPTALVG